VLKTSTSERKTLIEKIDWTTVIIYLILVIFGWINIYASVFNEDHQSIFDIDERYGKQMIWIIVAIVFIIGIFTIQGNVYSFLSYFFYGFMLILLLSVAIFGKEVNGARSWFEIGSFKIQPSEFTKFATALALARLMSHEGFKLMKFENLLKVGAIILIPAALIMLQPDTGSALVYLAFILTLYREGLPGIFIIFMALAVALFVASFFVEIYLIIIILVFVAFIIYSLFSKFSIEIVKAALIFLGYIVIGISAIILFWLNIPIYAIVAISFLLASIHYIVWAFKRKDKIVFYFVGVIFFSIIYTYSVDYIFHNVLDDHQQTRINVLFGVVEDIQGAGYNVHQSKIAIGSGGIVGKGFLQGTQTKYNFVPEQDTDFIFCTVGEEWGFLGSSIVLILFLILILRIIYLSEQQKSTFSRIYGYGTATIIFLHVSVNVGMTIGLAPVIGIPLPFFSYGGSSLWAFTILLFIFLRLDTSRHETF